VGPFLACGPVKNDFTSKKYQMFTAGLGAILASFGISPNLEHY
jgi:hypothetical protein